MRVRLLVLVGIAIAIYLHSCRGGHAVAPPPAPGASAAEVAVRADSDRADLVMLRAAMARLRKLDIAAGKLRLAGTVIDDQAQPIAGAMVTLDQQRTVASGSDGSFAFDELAAGDYQVSAEQGVAYGEDSRSLAEGADPWKIVLRVGPTLVVHVVDRAGTSVLGAKLSVDRHVDTFTDRDGKASFRAMAFGDTIIEVTASGYASERLNPDLGEDPGRTIEQEVVLQATAPIGGLVVDQDSKPVPGARVSVASATHHREDTTTADAQGRWQLLGFGSGNLALSATSDVDVAVPAPLVPFDGTSPRLDLIIHVDRGATIGGLVVDSAGKPLAGARVSVADGNVETDDHGRFLVSAVEAGSATIDATIDTRAMPPQTVDVPRGGHVEVRLVLAESSLAGVVTTSSGEPIADMQVFADGGPSSSFTRTDESGNFDFGALVPGDYQLKAMRDSDTIGVLGKTVHTGDRKVVLVLPDASSITGRVVMHGQPVAYYGIRIARAGDDDSYAALAPLRTDDGRFMRTNLRPGTMRVTVVGPTFVRKVIENVGLAEGQRLDLGDIDVEPGKSLRGRVVAASGDPIAGAVVVVDSNGDVAERVSLYNMMYGSRYASTDAAGHFEVAGIADDATDSNMQIGASDPEHGIAVPRVLAADDFDHDVELVLAATGSLSGTITNNKPGLGYVVFVHSTDADQRSFSTLAYDGELAIPQLPPGDYMAQLDSDLVTPPIAFHIAPAQTTSITFARPASLVTVVVEIVGGTCNNGVVLKPAGGGDAAWAVATASCVDSVHAAIEHVAPARYDVCDSGCESIEVAESPAQQTFAFTEHASQDSSPEDSPAPEDPPSPDPSQAPSPQDPSPDPAAEADPPAAVDEAASPAD